MEKLAKMAMLKIEDVEDLKEDIQEALVMAGILEEVDCNINLSELDGHLREDVVIQEFTKEELTKNAPLKNDDFFIVPKIVG